MNHIRERLGLRKIINAAGPVSLLGGGVPSEPAIDAALSVLSTAVDIAELQDRASATIARAFGSEAGYVTAGSAAAISIAVAAAMTGNDRERVAQLPDTRGMKGLVVLQTGHDANFGARVSQLIRLSGALPVFAGEADRCSPDALRQMLTSETAAAVYVVSHHTAPNGMIEIAEFCEICHSRAIPVIVDAAGEYDLRDQLDAGADLAIASAHKNYGALTAGIVAGRKDLIDACRLQDHGIGRPMKVGKEGIASVIAALDLWARRDRADAYAVWKRRSAIAIDLLAGLRVELAVDMSGSPLYRARVHVNDANRVVTQLAAGQPSIRVWQHGLKLGFFEIDPRLITDEDMVMICSVLLKLLRDLESQ